MKGGVSRTRIAIVAVFAALSAIFLAPTVFGDKLPGWWDKAFPARGIRLGLDLRGGVFIQLGVETDRGVGRRLETVSAAVRAEFDDPDSSIKSSGVSDFVLTMEFADTAALAKAQRVVERRFEEFTSEANGASIRIFAGQVGVNQIRDDSMEQVRQVIENRVLDFGLVEPSITRLGSDRIVIQVPGASGGDRDRIVDIIKKTAVLEF